MKMAHGLKTLLLRLNFLLIFFALISLSDNAFSKTLKVDELTAFATNGDLTLTINGSGDIVLGAFSGVLKATSGVLSAGDVDLTSEVTGVLPVANGGTNSSAALNNNFVMISSSGAIVEDSAISITELSYLDGVTSNLQSQLDNFTTSPTTTLGDVIVRGASVDERLPIGASDEVLTSNGTTASWQSAPVSTTLTTKGDIQTYDTANSRIGVGADGSFLIADSAESTGLKWSTTLQGTLNPVSDWVDGGATIITATTTAPTKASSLAVDQMWYKIVGDEAIVRIEYKQNNGTGAVNGSGDYLFSMPASLKIDLTKVAEYATVEGSGTWSSTNSVGSVSAWSTANNVGGSVVVYDEDSVRMFFSNASAEGVMGSGYSALGNGNVVLIADFRVPIQGYSSGIDAVATKSELCTIEANNNDTDNVVAATEDIPWKTEVTDNCNIYDNSGNAGADTNDAITPTRNMNVTISGAVNQSLSPATSVTIYKDGTEHKACGVLDGVTARGTFGCAASLVSGSAYTFRFSDAGTNLSPSSVFHNLFVQELPSDEQSVVASIEDATYSPSSGNGKSRICSFRIVAADECTNVIGNCISDCENTSTGNADITFNTSYWSGTSYNCTGTAIDHNGTIKFEDATKTATNSKVVVLNTAPSGVNEDADIVCHGIAP